MGHCYDFPTGACHKLPYLFPPVTLLIPQHLLNSPVELPALPFGSPAESFLILSPRPVPCMPPGKQSILSRGVCCLQNLERPARRCASLCWEFSAPALSTWEGISQHVPNHWIPRNSTEVACSQIFPESISHVLEYIYLTGFLVR